MEYILAYDFGTSGVKAVLFQKDGELAASCSRTYPLLRPEPLHVEQRPEDFWNAVCETTKGCLADSGISPADVKALSFSVQAVTLIPVDRDGNCLDNAISWLDSRAGEEAEEINAGIGMPLVRSQDPQARMLWFRRHRPDIYEKAAYFLECDGYLQYRATGILEVPADYDGCLQPNPVMKEYYAVTFSDEDRSKLPPQVEACRVFGCLDEKGAGELGLIPGITVFGGMIDVPAAAAGCGVCLPGEGHLYLGSSGWLSAVIDEPAEISEGAYILNSILPGRMIYGGCTNSCCLMQDWAVGRFYAAEREVLGSAVYDLITEEVRQTPDGCDGLYAAPWLDGEQFPIADTFVRACFFNISTEHTRAHFIRAVWESICFSMRGQVDLLKKDTGIELSELGANGGGSNNPVWMQMMADVLQMKIRVPSDAQHSGAVGAALAAAIGLGWCTENDLKDYVKTEREYYPDPSKKELYDAKYRNFFRLYESIRDLSREINGSEHD